MIGKSGHVSSDRLGDAARHGDLSILRESEQSHVRTCDSCRQLYGGYRLTDRLLSADWRETRLPASAAAPAVSPAAALGARLSGAVRGFDARRMAPGLAALAAVALIAAAIGLPRLAPPPRAASPSPVAALSPTESSSPATSRPSADAASPSPSPSGPAAASAPAGQSSAASGSAGGIALSLARVAGLPVAWSPDGAHLLLATSALPRSFEIRDASGRVTGSLSADTAVWVDSNTIAFTARGAQPTPSLSPSATPTSDPGQSATPAPTPRQSGRHGGFPTPESSTTAASTPSPAGNRPESVGLADIHGKVRSTLPVSYPTWVGVPNGMIVSDGSGEFTVAGQQGMAWQYGLWTVSGTSALAAGTGNGIPISFSRDGSRLAVLHPSAWSVTGVTGWLEVVSVPKLNSVASFGRVVVKAGTGYQGSAFGFDAAFGPDDRSLLVSGVLVNLANGAVATVGRGGWTADGLLVTASPAGLVRWNAGRSTADSRFAGPGRVMIARHGELIYLFDSDRAPLFLNTNGQLSTLSLTGVRSIAHLLISPSGRAIALDGRATDGSSIAAVAPLP